LPASADGSPKVDFSDRPGCGEWFYMGDLDQMFTRIHDQEIEISESFCLDDLT
jgi:hypothetical protein